MKMTVKLRAASRADTYNITSPFFYATITRGRRVVKMQGRYNPLGHFSLDFTSGHEKLAALERAHIASAAVRAMRKRMKKSDEKFCKAYDRAHNGIIDAMIAGRF